MATTVKKKATPPKSTRRRKVGSSWLAWAMIALGIVAVPIGLRGASILALSGPTMLAMLYPYVVLLKDSSVAIPLWIANPVAQCLLYLQFPLYGVFMAWIHRRRGFWIGLNAVIWLHVLGCVAAVLFAHVLNPYLRF